MENAVDIEIPSSPIKVILGIVFARYNQFTFLILPTIKNTTKHIIFVATIVAPTGVDKRMDNRIPRTAHTTDIITEQMVTLLKLLNTLIAESAGKITSAEIRRDPTRFIPRTIIIAVIIAITRL